VLQYDSAAGHCVCRVYKKDLAKLMVDRAMKITVIHSFAVLVFDFDKRTSRFAPM
jgi:hypothetical protein